MKNVNVTVALLVEFKKIQLRTVFTVALYAQ